MHLDEGNGQLEYEQKHVYAGSERIEQFTDKGNWERTLYVLPIVLHSIPPQNYSIPALALLRLFLLL